MPPLFLFTLALARLLTIAGYDSATSASVYAIKECRGCRLGRWCGSKSREGTVVLDVQDITNGSEWPIYSAACA